MFNYSKIQQFDDVTRFRLINMWLVAFGSELIYPVITDLKGELFTSFIITIFMILAILSAKTNEYFVKHFTLSQLYRITTLLHLAFTMIGVLYFYNKLVMLYVDSFLIVLEGMIISSYSIKLTNYIAENHTKDISNFQTFRNSIMADSALLSLLLVAVLTYFFDNSIVVITFIIINAMVSAWLFYNWNYFKNKGL